MKKLFAVIKREYVQRVRTKFFVVATILGRLLMAGFTVVPALMLSMKTGGPTRLAIIDQTGKMYGRVARELQSSPRDDDENPAPTPVQPAVGPAASQERARQAAQMVRGSFVVEEARPENKTLDQLKQELEARIQNRGLDAYVVLPADLIANGEPEYRSRNAADPFTRSFIQRAINQAVRSERLANAGIKEEAIQLASKPVSLKSAEADGKQSGEGGFFLVFGLGLLIYMSVLLYGQVVLGAVVEEKETRIAEVLFSSMRSFPLMMGKLIGVSLVALTQMGIWLGAFLIFSVWAAG